MVRVLKGICSISLSACILLSACKTQHNLCSDKKIVYYIFDSLEQCMLQDAKKEYRKYVVKGIVIDPKATLFTHEQFGNRGNDSIYQFATIIGRKNRKSNYPDPIEKVLQTSDRYVLIGNRKVPAYFYHLDDIFDEYSGKISIFNYYHSSAGRIYKVYTANMKRKILIP